MGDTYLEDLFTIFEDYQKVWRNAELPDETEHEFKIKIGSIKGTEVFFHGIIDEIYSNLSIGEHKTFTTAPKLSILAMNTQVCLYSKAYELERGKKIDRVQWDYIRSVPASYPIWLEKSKRFSEANNTKITHLSWLRACDERGIVDQATRAKALNYEANVSDSFFRHTIELIPSMVDTVWDGFKFVCKDIVNRGKTNKVKNITRDCDWCNFRPICFAEFTGADVNYIKNHDYVTRERDDG